MKNIKRWWVFGVLGLVTFSGSLASAGVPDCLDDARRPLEVDNARAVELKKSSPLGRTVRARVAGRVTRVFPDKVNNSGTVHAHFEIRIGDGPRDVLEVVYSEDFGEMPNPGIGAYVEACGDFINAYATNNGFPPSPSGAIIHWVHRSNSRHPHGYVLLDNVLYGFGEDERGKRRDDRPDHGNSRPRGRSYREERSFEPAA